VVGALARVRAVAPGDGMRVAASAAETVSRRVYQHFVALDQAVGPSDLEAIRAQTLATNPLLERQEVEDITAQVSQQLFGFGVLEPLLADPTVTELMVNGPGAVWVERGGELAPTEVSIDAMGLRVIIERILGPLGLRVDRTSPFVDARLPDGSRVNIAVAPLALDGPYLTIRRFEAHGLDLNSFARPAVVALLQQAVRERSNMVISGATGAGKTSLLNALAAHIAPRERVITIEDAAELRLPGEHTVRLEARPPNAEGIGQITVRSLVRNALRMRPDRIIIGECRGAEALDMIQAMNTGHDGSLTTCHANSPLDALRRIEAMALMADVELPVSVVREHLESAVGIVVQVARQHNGSRQVMAMYQCGAHARWLVRDGLPQ